MDHSIRMTYFRNSSENFGEALISFSLIYTIEKWIIVIKGNLYGGIWSELNIIIPDRTTLKNNLNLNSTSLRLKLQYNMVVFPLCQPGFGDSMGAIKLGMGHGAPS